MRLTTKLTAFQESLVRSAVGPEAQITGAQYLQELRPCPIRVDVRSGGDTVSVVLRISRNAGGVEREAAVLPALRSLGLPVPMILAGPAMDPDAPELFSMMVTEFLRGDALQIWATHSRAGMNLASDLLVEAISAMHSAVLEGLPRRSLADDLRIVLERGGEWVQVKEWEKSSSIVERLTLEVSCPLVFSSGDYQPANFLSDGRVLTGMVDFEKAAYTDPLAALARYPVYDLKPLSDSEFIATMVKSAGFEPRDFALRVAVFSLRTLQIKFPVFGGSELVQRKRDHVLSVLNKATRTLSA